MHRCIFFRAPETSGESEVGYRLLPESVGCGLDRPRVLPAGCPLGSVGFIRTSLWARCPSVVVGFAWLPYGQPAFSVVAVHQCPLTASCPARRCEVRLAGLEASCLVANRFPATVTLPPLLCCLPAAKCRWMVAGACGLERPFVVIDAVHFFLSFVFMLENPLASKESLVVWPLFLANWS